ncbi:TPA: DNA primase, partial [Enterobacter roggenkampii]|nr:DNA primase [Enterobacter roggenkampii]
MKMKNAPNIKFLPKDKFTEAIIFAGEDAYSHVQHWIESEGKRAWDDVPPVYLGKRQLAELERLNIVDNGRRSVRVIRAGELSEMQISTIATKLALADVKEARLFNGMFEPQPKEDWTGRLPRLKEEAERGESIVVNLPVKKREPKPEPGDELKPRVESRSDGLYWITPKVDKDSGEIINNETWLCSPLEVVGSGSDGAERYLVLRWRSPRGHEDITRAIPCA